jgi:hypothetical protein
VRGLVPELIAEIERLQASGPWVEHVEYQRAMKRERDGGCICDGNPATTGGPEEDCPWHGREYRYWVDGCASLAAEVERLRGAVSMHRSVVTETMDDRWLCCDNCGMDWPCPTAERSGAADDCP